MASKSQRLLIVVADDIGIGPNTTTGILQLASRGVVTGSALLVNSPHAGDAVRRWRQQGSCLELGWHPNLTLDTPVSPPTQVPTLVRSDGTFWPLGIFLKRWLLGILDPIEIEREWRAQRDRFRELVGHWPTFVNCHQHISLFTPIGDILLNLLSDLPTKPYLRRVQEPWAIVRRLAGARVKRVFLNCLGRRLSRRQKAQGFPGNDWLAGIANPACALDPRFFARWLEAMPGNVVELMCHPGQFDSTLVGRDCREDDGLQQQRINELRWLSDPAFLEAVNAANFRLASPWEAAGANSLSCQIA